MSEKITEEQKKALGKVIRGHMLASFFISMKYVLLILVAAFLTVMINVFYVKSDSFIFPMQIVNILFLMHFMIQETAAKRKQFNADVRKIIYPDQEVK